MRHCFLIAFILLAASSIASAQSIEVGLRDNLYAHADFISPTGWLAGYEQSLLNASIKEQNGRIFAGYVYNRKGWSLSSAAYMGTEYTGSWQAYGVLAECIYHFNRFYVDAVLNPHYDSGLGFDFCYRGEVGIMLWAEHELNEKLEACFSYGNVPEYRMPENSFRAGVKFSSGRIWVKPMICLPHYYKDYGQKHIRVNFSFGWTLDI